MRAPILNLVNTPMLMEPTAYEAMANSLAVMEYDDEYDMVPASPKLIDGQKVAVIPVHGPLSHRPDFWSFLLGGTSYLELKHCIMQAAEMQECGGILLDFDTPGGDSAGAFDFADWLSDLERQLRGTKPIWGVVNERAASGGCLLASCMEKVFIPRTGRIGSVGVVMTHMDVSEYDAKEGFKYEFIYRGDRKIDGTPHRPLAPEARARMEADCDMLYGMFVDAVARNRGMAASKVKATEAGMFTGAAGVSIGLATEVASFDEVIQMMVKKVGKNGGRRMAGMSSALTSEIQSRILAADSDVSTEPQSGGARAVATAPGDQIQITRLPAGDSRHSTDTPAPIGAEEQAMKFSTSFLAGLGLTEGADVGAIESAVSALAKTGTTMAAQLTQASESLQAAQSQVSALSTRLEAVTGERDAQKTAAAEARLEIETVRRERDAAVCQVTTLQASLEQASADAKAAKESVAAKDQALLEAHLGLAGFTGGSTEDAALVIGAKYLTDAKGDVKAAVAAHMEKNPGLYKQHDHAAVQRPATAGQRRQAVLPTSEGAANMGAAPSTREIGADDINREIEEERRRREIRA